jgi:NAD(P)-dependent dehydrogenase (short-subunit alcohol dehydrogenase family)
MPAMAKARDGLQEIVRIGPGAHIASRDCCFEQHLQRRPEPGFQVIRQCIERRIARVKRGGETALRGNEVDQPLQPTFQRITRLVFGSGREGGIGARIDLIPQDGHDQIRTPRKAAVDRADADPGPLGDFAHRSVHARGREHGQRRLQQGVVIALGVGAQRPDRRFFAHCRVTLQAERCSGYNRNMVPDNSSGRPVALVTGANKGIGLQIATDLAEAGFTVLVGARNLEVGAAAARGIGPDAHAVQLDVTDHPSIAAAADRIRTEFGRLDVLVNNAGISNTEKPGTPFEEILKNSYPSSAPLDDLRAIFETNVFGVVAVTQAMLPLLREAPLARIVNVSSSSGSLTLNSDPANPHRPMFRYYSASKTALNAVTLAFAIELEAAGIKVNAACPGFTSTNLNNFRGTRTVQEGAREAVRLALIGADGPTGTFSNEDGPVPW